MGLSGDEEGVGIFWKEGMGLSGDDELGRDFVSSMGVYGCLSGDGKLGFLDSSLVRVVYL